MASSKKTIEMKPGIVKAHCSLIAPKISAQVVYKRGTSVMWLTPKEARDFGSKLISAADMCIKDRKTE